MYSVKSLTFHRYSLKKEILIKFYEKTRSILGTLLVSSALFAQILNQPANWPNPAWTLTGTFDPAFANDPTTTANFGYDDDGAGLGSIDELVATSPVYDLNAAIAGGRQHSNSGRFV